MYTLETLIDIFSANKIYPKPDFQKSEDKRSEHNSNSILQEMFQSIDVFKLLFSQKQIFSSSIYIFRLDE